MKGKHGKIKKMRQDVIWEHAFFTLDDLYNNYIYNDEKFKDMLLALVKYADNKISPPDDKGEIVNKYVVIEYEENNIKS